LFAVGCESAPDTGTTEPSLHGLDDLIRHIAFEEGLEGSPKVDFPEVSAEDQELIDKRSALGRFLFFDQELGGQRHSSCATCHHPAFHGADGQNIAKGVFCTIGWEGQSREWDNGDEVFCDVAPPDGTGGNVVGPFRTAPLNERNSPSVLNSPLFPKQMLDGRFHFVDASSTDVNELDPDLGFNVQPPDGVLFTRSLLAAQAFKPVPSVIEMAGDFPFDGQPLPPPEIFNPAVQDAIADRLDNISAYRDLFEAAYPRQVFDTDPVITESDPITYDAIADAMATWEDRTLVMTDSPWDAFLLGDDDAISATAKRGALIFFTWGKCSQCHSGDLFTDFENHNIGVPQVGPGFGNSDPAPEYGGFDTWDFGAENTTGDRGDRFKFRTPPLRGITLTSPYMHNGAYADLGDAIRHHSNPYAFYRRYDEDQLLPEVAGHGLKPLGPVFDSSNPVVLGPGSGTLIWLGSRHVDDLIEFLRALTDPAMLDFVNAAPAELPSGFPADVAGPRFYPLFE
jgi:cytochrome c peroxidase